MTSLSKYIEISLFELERIERKKFLLIKPYFNNTITFSKFHFDFKRLKFIRRCKVNLSGCYLISMYKISIFKDENLILERNEIGRIESLRYISEGNISEAVYLFYGRDNIVRSGWFELIESYHTNKNAYKEKLKEIICKLKMINL